jgi:serine/threonine protein kinase
VTDQLVVGGQLGNYLIDSVIGRGGMSVVYGAKHARLGMTVALKVLAPELSTDDTFRERFLREAQIAAGIDHPNVIPINDMGLHEDSLYIVMRFVAGGDLKTLLSESGPLELEQALKLALPVALALDAAHAAGLVHRDVKPANILIQRSSRGEIEHVYLTDFGIAKSASFAGALTRSGASIGTVGYMAPEQLEGGEVSPQTDVYALAVTFYECLAGRIPHQRELAEGVHPPKGPLEPLSRIRPEIPAALDAVIARALSSDPAERPTTCEEFVRECRAAVAGAAAATVLSEPPAIGEPRSEDPPMVPPLPPSPAPVAAGEGSSPPADTGTSRRHLYGAAGVLAVVAAAVVAVVLLVSGSSTPAGEGFSSALAAVPRNHVTGSGQATIRLNGNEAAVTVSTEGLDNGAELVHLMHIHAGRKGECPPASAARLHNGHLAISTTDGINYYGPPVLALTTRGDTGVGSILAFPRFPSGGVLHYSRTIALSQSVIADIRRDDAVVVVHGTDYDGTGIYSGVLDPSELNKSVPGTATAPALCGRLTGVQSASAGGPHSGHTSILYIAALHRPAASAVSSVGSGAPLRGVFFCHVGEVAGVAGETRAAAGVLEDASQATA